MIVMCWRGPVTIYCTGLELRVDGWVNELLVRQSPADEKVSTEAEQNVALHHQATGGEDITN
jgi:hypothetical protein